MNLCVELGDVSDPPAQHQHHRWPRNGPSRQRRRLRREAERQVEKAARNAEPSAEEATGGEKRQTEEAIIPPKDTTNESETVQHEFCSNESFEKLSDDDLVEEILVTADCQADWSDPVVTLTKCFFIDRHSHL